MTATQPNYLSISRRSLDVEDYFDLARRHAAWIAGPIFAGLVISIVVAMLLPNKYDSKATMQITPAQVSDALVPATISQKLSERISQMQGNIMSRTSLSNLINSPYLNLYREEQASGTMEDVIEEMRKNLNIKLTGISTLGAKHASTFEIIFQYRNRIKAQATVQALITRFQEENQTAQRNQQTTLKAMFDEGVTSTKANLDKADDALTKFRVANSGHLPEQTSANIAAMTSLQGEASSAREQLNRLATTRMQIETNISAIRAQAEAAKLFFANTQDASSPQQASSPAARQNAELAQMNRQIDNGELTLQQYLQSYKESHPDVKALRKSLGVLKAKRDQLQAQQDKEQEDAAAAALLASQNKEPVTKKADPRLIATLTDFQLKIEAQNGALKSNDIEQQYRTKELDGFSKQIASYRDRLAPSGVEAELSDLLREQANATELYQAALRRQQMTMQSGEVVQRGAGELLEVIDPPSLPDKPTKPNRYMIVGAGVALSILVGLALAGVQEAKDTSLKNLKDVRAYTNLPVLGSIPLLENTMLVKRKRRIAYLGWSAAVLIGVIAVCSSIFYYYSVTSIQ